MYSVVMALGTVEAALTAIPAVVACYVVSGEADFLVEAVVPSLHDYESLLLDQLLWPSTRSTTHAAPSPSAPCSAEARSPSARSAADATSARWSSVPTS